MSRGLIDEFGIPMKRIASLSIFFTGLIEFVIEPARFDLWIVTAVAIVTLLWNLVRRALRSHMARRNTTTVRPFPGDQVDDAAERQLPQW